MAGACDFQSWLYLDGAGLYCEPGHFHVDPHRPVKRAIITHGHADHARPGHHAVLATPETVKIMRSRLREAAGAHFQPTAYGKRTNINGVTVWLASAGHILGSAQVVLEWNGMRAVISGDYKRRLDPTAEPFELVECGLFVTEATFGLPVFRHEPDQSEIARLLTSLELNPDRPHLVGAYGLGKCQRLIALLRQEGFDRRIWLHGTLTKTCDLYEQLNVPLGPLSPVANVDRKSLTGEIILAPPSALNDRWSRRLADPLTCFASGWMRVRGRARQRGVELPLVISDHADWPELITTIRETGAEEIWVTHGREDALVHQIGLMGRKAMALTLIGREDEDE